MKKSLLSVLALAATVGANADVIVDVDQTYAGMESFPYYVMEFTPEMKDGNMVVTNTEAKDANYLVQYFVCYDFTATKDVEYTVTAKIKSDVSGNIDVVMGNWGETVTKPMAVTGDNEWKEYSVKISDVTTDKSFVIFQSGKMVGTYEIQWVKVTHESDPVVLPTTGDLVAEFYTGNDATFGGWGDAIFENVEEDGKPCLKFTNTTSKDSWAVQAAINCDFTVGTTYYLGFDIKGTPATGLTASFQGSGDVDGTTQYDGKGSMTKFNVTDEWQHVIIYGECGEGNYPQLPATRLLFDLGKYVGTFYMTNVTLYTEKKGQTSLVESIATMSENHWTVYNLQGVKVLDTDDESVLSSLVPGLYIINGKKVAVCR